MGWRDEKLNNLNDYFPCITMSYICTENDLLSCVHKYRIEGGVLYKNVLSSSQFIGVRHSSGVLFFF